MDKKPSIYSIFPPIYFIRYGPELKEYNTASGTEYLMVDSDTYSSSSFAGNTRRYHGLYIDGTKLVLSSLDDRVNGIRLSPAHYRGVFTDESLTYLKGATLYPVTLLYTLPDAMVLKTIELDHGLSIRYDIIGSAEISLKPLFGFREVGSLNKNNYQIRWEKVENGISYLDYTLTSSLPYQHNPCIYYDNYYQVEEKRGYDALENLDSPGKFSGHITDSHFTVTLTDSKRSSNQKNSKKLEMVKRAPDIFLLNNSIIAGFYWFREPWGRDALISVPGLLLSNNLFKEAENVFRFFLKHEKEGRILNRWPDNYHSSDAPLWLFWAVRQYMISNPDSRFLKETRPILERLLNKYPENGICSLEGSLIRVRAGSTWMDTRHTSREGLPVEINALWLHALETAEILDISLPVDRKTAENEFQGFWNKERGYLFDTINPDDPTLRPNQLIALGLGFLSDKQAISAMTALKREIITPYGPRSLGKSEPGYFGSFIGDVSYHNGMVWPWLTGFEIETRIRLSEPASNLKQRLFPLWNYLITSGAGTIPELFDGDAPHHPQGAIAQAWSVAEFVRSMGAVRNYMGENGVESISGSV